LTFDGDSKLIVADLGTGSYNMKLKVYKGTSLMSESAILDLPTAVVTFHMQSYQASNPAIAVASGPFIYIYKNLRPYYKFTLPGQDVHPLEKDIWEQAKEDKVDIMVAREMLDALRNEHGAGILTARSLRFLQLHPSDMESFANVHKHAPLKKQDVITCLSTLKKCDANEDPVSCVVLGTEARDVMILDPEAFTVLSKMTLPSIPVFFSISGLYDVEFRIVAACRNAKLYTIKKGGKSGKMICELSSQVVGLERISKTIIVACMDRSLTGFTSKGKKIWALHLPADITTMTTLNHKSKGLKAVIVALSNNEVRIYKDNFLVNLIKTDDVVTGIQFGKFGREESVLIMTTKGGGMIIKILKRTAEFEGKDLKLSGKSASQTKLNIPKKTKLFLDQTLRERENATVMHRTFQSDLQKLRLLTARSYVKALHSSLNPVSSAACDPVKLNCAVQGLGPSFKLTVNLENTSPNIPSQNLLLSFYADRNLYSVSKPFVEVPILIPGISYSYEILEECITDKAISDKVKVFLLNRGKSKPIISAVISMPVSEALVVV
jgi:Bardet-Biedl syndrome 1 protein